LLVICVGKLCFVYANAPFDENTLGWMMPIGSAAPTAAVEVFIRKSWTLSETVYFEHNRTLSSGVRR
jgi:hypothetical protein